MAKKEAKSKCWVTEGYGCPEYLNGRFYDTYKCRDRRPDSPCQTGQAPVTSTRKEGVPAPLSNKKYITFVKVRRVGGGRKGKRAALGLTIPAWVCDKLELKSGSGIIITVERSRKLEIDEIWKGFEKVKV